MKYIKKFENINFDDIDMEEYDEKGEILIKLKNSVINIFRADLDNGDVEPLSEYIQNVDQDILEKFNNKCQEKFGIIGGDYMDEIVINNINHILFGNEELTYLVKELVDNLIKTNLENTIYYLPDPIFEEYKKELLD